MSKRVNTKKAINTSKAVKTVKAIEKVEPIIVEATQAEATQAVQTAEATQAATQAVENRKTVMEALSVWNTKAVKENLKAITGLKLFYQYQKMLTDNKNLSDTVKKSFLVLFACKEKELIASVPIIVIPSNVSKPIVGAPKLPIEAKKVPVRKDYTIEDLMGGKCPIGTILVNSLETEGYIKSWDIDLGIRIQYSKCRFYVIPLEGQKKLKKGILVDNWEIPAEFKIIELYNME